MQNTLYNTLSNGSAYGNGQYSKVSTTSLPAPTDTVPARVTDWAAGLGTPIANNLVPLLAGSTIAQGLLPTVKGTGDGVVFGSSGSSSDSYYSSSGTGQGSGGLFSNAGSVSITPVSPTAAGVNGATAGVFLFPFALPATSTSQVATGMIGTSTSASDCVGNIALAAPTRHPRRPAAPRLRHRRTLWPCKTTFFFGPTAGMARPRRGGWAARGLTGRTSNTHPTVCS